MTAARAAGPRMRQAARFVSEHPGCSIKRVAEHLVDSRQYPSRSLSGGYAIVHRAIAAGLIIIARRGPGRKAMYELSPATNEE